MPFGCIMTVPTPVGYAGNVTGHAQGVAPAKLHPDGPGNAMPRSSQS